MRAFVFVPHTSYCSIDHDLTSSVCAHSFNKKSHVSVLFLCGTENTFSASTVEGGTPAVVPLCRYFFVWCEALVVEGRTTAHHQHASKDGNDNNNVAVWSVRRFSQINLTLRYFPPLVVAICWKTANLRTVGDKPGRHLQDNGESRKHFRRKNLQVPSRSCP